jgi:hypothetical protein
MIRYILVFIVVFVGLPFWVCAQRKTVDAPIPNDEFNRIERVRKLFNQYHIYEGERILKGYIKEKPNNPYYREALVQLQQQVLNRIKKANQVLDDIGSNASNSWDETGSVEEQIAEWNGLDRSLFNTIDRNKGTSKSTMENTSKLGNGEGEWVDGSDDNELEGENLFVGPKGKERLRKRQLKLLTDLSELPFGAYKSDLIQNARLATLQVRGADTCSHLLRYYLVDTANIEPVMTDDDADKLETALQEIYSNLPGDAIVKIEELLIRYPTSYSLFMHRAKAEYLLGSDTGALKTYMMAQSLQPSRSEPYYERARIFYEMGRYVDAGAEIILALNRYPEETYKDWLRRIADRSGKAIIDPWIQREVYPVMPADVWQDRVAKPTSPWFYYQAAKQEVVKFADASGVLLPNDSTKERYLETYCWKRMLDSADANTFAFARLMQELGYLDCFALVTQFHQDLFPQYVAFVNNNEDKVKKYYYLLINWEDKRYEKYRKRLAVLSGKSGWKKKRRK